MTLHQVVEAPCLAPLAERYGEFSFEAFRLGRSTMLLDQLAAMTFDDAVAETVSRWAWDRGDRMAIREIGPETDRLHIFAVRKSGTGRTVWNGHVPSVSHARFLDPICVVDLSIIAGIPFGLLGSEVALHGRRQDARPYGAFRVGEGR